MIFVFDRVENIEGKGEPALSPFSHNIFTRLLILACEKSALCGKEFRINIQFHLLISGCKAERLNVGIQDRPKLIVSTVSNQAYYVHLKTYNKTRGP